MINAENNKRLDVDLQHKATHEEKMDVINNSAKNEVSATEKTNEATNEASNEREPVTA